MVAASAGGINDILARVIGQKLAESFGQPVVIDRQQAGSRDDPWAPGLAAGVLPDGYTLLGAPMASMAVTPAMYPKLSYAPQRFFDAGVAVSGFPALARRDQRGARPHRLRADRLHQGQSRQSEQPAARR